VSTGTLGTAPGDAKQKKAPDADPKGAVVRLALASLRYRAMASLATFIAVLLGCSLLIACGGLFETAIRLNATPQRLAGAPVVLTGSEGFKLPDEESQLAPYSERTGIPVGAVAQIAAIPGVGQAVPDVSFPAVVVANGQPAVGSTVLSGHDWASAALTPYTLTSGGAPTAPGQVVLDAQSAAAAGAQPGSRVDIAIDGQPQGFVVSGIARPGGRVDAPALFFSAPDAARFSPHPGLVDAIGVLPASGTSADDLAGKLGGHLPDGLTMLTGDDRGAAEFPGIDGSQLPLILLSSVFGGMVLVVMALVVSATISLSVRQRQQELALLRATGATPRQVHRMVVVETMVVSAFAVLGGLVLGRIVGSAIFDLSASRGVIPSALEFRQGIIPFAGGALVSLVAPYVTASFAALAAARSKPIQALAEAKIPPVQVGPARWMLARIFAVVTVGLAIATMFLDPDTASAVGGPAVLTGAIAVGLLGPEVINAIVGRLSGIVRRISPQNGHLAVVNTQSRGVQFAAVLTPIALAVAIALGNVYSQTTQDEAAIQGHADQLRADAVVSSATGGVSPDLLAQVRGTPGVAFASAMVNSQGWIENPYDGHGTDPSTLLGLDAQDQNPVLNVPVTSGSLRDLTGNSVAVPESEAGDLGIKLGDQITMRLGDGAQANVRVVALLDSPSNYESVVLPASLLAPHTSAGLPTKILVRTDSSHDASAVVGDLQQRVQGWPGTSVGDQSVLEAEFTAGLGVQAWINYLLAVLAIAYAAIASVNTLAVAVLSRRREFAVQRLAGATRRQVRRMLYLEGSIIAVAGLVLGTVISLFTVLPTAVAVGLWIPTGPVWVFLAVIVSIFLIVWPVTSLSSRLAMKRKPIEAIHAPGE
jgi:putative ABC transport system permease protein